MRIQQGFILVFTLMILTLISLFVVKTLEHTVLYSKVIYQQEERYHAFYQLERVTQKLMTKAISPVCTAKQDDANAIIERLHSQHGCFYQEKKRTYTYFLEELGEYPCLVLFLHGHFYSTRHQRLSVLQKERGKKNALLQVRFVKPASLADCLLSRRLVLPLGQISWRYLIF